MQTIADVMTRDVKTVSPEDTVRHAAKLMDELNVGVLPVCDDAKLVGMITDRDITIRTTSAGESPTTTHVADIMTDQVRWCFDDQSVDEVMQQMGDMQSGVFLSLIITRINWKASCLSEIWRPGILPKSIAPWEKFRNRSPCKEFAESSVTRRRANRQQSILNSRVLRAT